MGKVSAAPFPSPESRKPAKEIKTPKTKKQDEPIIETEPIETDEVVD